jgi:hypothetical protein
MWPRIEETDFASKIFNDLAGAGVFRIFKILRNFRASDPERTVSLFLFHYEMRTCPFLVEMFSTI